MDYLVQHAHLRAHPEQLFPGFKSVISVTLNYWPEAENPAVVLGNPKKAYIARYALGRDYHKVFRQKLKKFAQALEAWIGPFGHRVFTDSAPIFEVETARQAGLGWRGKNTLLLSRQGSWQFIGEIYTDIPLPADVPEKQARHPHPEHCGECLACLDCCPTQAIVAPYQVDARRCISYLTIESPEPIPLALRPLMGNRIYGCDDCQISCPWNRFSQIGLADFQPRHGLDNADLLSLFAWSESDFERYTEGSPIRRIGHTRWLRNIAVALGNALRQNNSPDLSAAIRAALENRRPHPSPLVAEHVIWAIAQKPSNDAISRPISCL